MPHNRLLLKMKSEGNQTSKAVTARVHIENIRKTKFSVGSKLQNPLTKDLHNAVTRLSSELYAKDIHFLMELIQNAEDNKYLNTVEPTLEFVFTKEDVTGNGAPATLLVFNNEVGFSKADIDSICSIGQSTKKAKRSQGFIGEKGIGFKSVFLVSAQPYIFSNGYQIRFCEVPDGDCGIGYIVPEWITERPSIADLGRIYSDGKALPTTTIILPLKTEKVEAVKKELLQIHPEVVLFLQKIRRLTVRDEHTGLSSKGGSLSAVSIVNETTLIPSSTDVLDSRVVQLSATHGSGPNSLDTCRYYLHKQNFPIKSSIMVEERKDAKELMICLAFPFGKRLKGGGSAAGIFAYLPTGMVTNFPFIIHSDFVLASSRESILMDNRWNLGTLELVPLAYVQALMTCLKSVETIGLGTKSRVLDFLPIKESPFPQLNSARDAIKVMLQPESIVPCQSFLHEQIVLCQPSNALRICPKFRTILAKAKQQRITLGAITSQMKHAIHDSVDHEEYDEIWKFLGVTIADSYDWYLKYIKTSNLISRSSEDLYTDIIGFLGDNWANFPEMSLDSIPLVKYVTWSGDTMLCSVVQIRQKTLKVRMISKADEYAWLSNSNREIGCLNDVFFCPYYLINSFTKVKNQEKLLKWFTYTASVVITDVVQYCMELISFIREKKDPGSVVRLTYFVYLSTLKEHIKGDDVQRLLRFLPVVEKSGKVILCSRSWVPASIGTWPKLFGSINPLSVESLGRCSIEQHNLDRHNDTDERSQNCGYYAELGDDYSCAAEFNGVTIAENHLLNFLVKNKKAFDLPNAPPPNITLKLTSVNLTCDQALLLLKWIKNLRFAFANQLQRLSRFFESLARTNWLKTYAGFKSPIYCHLLDSLENKAILEMGRKLSVFSAIDELYYSSKIRSYINELEFLGVQVKAGTMFELIIPGVKRLASSKIVDPSLVILLLEVIKYLWESDNLYDDLVENLKEGKWVKTLNGYACPDGSVLLTSFEKAIAQITNLHVIDSSYYVNELSPFLEELEMLGVVVDVEEVYNLIPENFKFPEDPSSLTVDSVFLLLKCIRTVGIDAFCSNYDDIRCTAWMKTGCGFICPSETILYDSNLIDLADVASLSFVDESYYGVKIRSYKAELKAVGVIVDLDSAGEVVVNRLKSVIHSNGLKDFKVISLLKLLKSAKISVPSFVSIVVNYLSGEKWVKTKHGYKLAQDSILFDSKWGSISQLVDLPFIDETFYGVKIKICSFKEELKTLGAVVNLREGIRFIVHGLKIQEDPSLVTPDAAFLILLCTESLRNSDEPSDKILLEELLRKLRVAKWVKTHMGYRLPGEALLFNHEWECLLKEIDGPFIDREFYKKITSSLDSVLRVIGVRTELEDACDLIVKNLTSCVQSYQVNRIYMFLQKYHWTPKSDVHKLWIPDKSDNERGKWVNNVDCVIHDENNLFGHCLNSLDNYYHIDFLPFLQSAFDVPEVPSLHHHVALWKFWCEAADNVSVEKLNLFWGLLSRNWVGDISINQEKFKSKIPAVGTQSGIDIKLLEKEEVYIGDDLLLKKAFLEACDGPLFAWFPEEDNSISSSTLHEIYRSLGVKKISESVEYSVNGIFRKMEKEVGLIGKPLLKLVMAFLASPKMSVPTKERQSMANALCDIPIFGTNVQLQVKYRLRLPLSRKCLHAYINKKVFFDSNLSRFIVHRPSCCYTRQNDIILINDFARAISEAVLPDCEDLTKLIKMGFSFLLNDHEIHDLLTTENLEVSVADQEFLDTLFSPVVVIPSSSRTLHDGNAVLPKPTKTSFKRRHATRRSPFK